MSNAHEHTGKKGGKHDEEGTDAGHGEEEGMADWRAEREETGDPRKYPKVYTAQDIARILKVSDDTVYRKMRKRELPPPLPLSRVHRWNGRVFDKWVEDGCPKMKAVSKKGPANKAPPRPGKKRRKDGQ